MLCETLRELQSAQAHRLQPLCDGNAGALHLRVFNAGMIVDKPTADIWLREF
jgi:hypothetical protein